MLQILSRSTALEKETYQKKKAKHYKQQRIDTVKLIWSPQVIVMNTQRVIADVIMQSYANKLNFNCCCVSSYQLAKIMRGPSVDFINAMHLLLVITFNEKTIACLHTSCKDLNDMFVKK